jgi:hypothetical protein
MVDLVPPPKMSISGSNAGTQLQGGTSRPSRGSLSSTSQQSHRNSPSHGEDHPRKPVPCTKSLSSLLQPYLQPTAESDPGE